jgi:hypothetical protein
MGCGLRGNRPANIEDILGAVYTDPRDLPRFKWLYLQHGNTEYEALYPPETAGSISAAPLYEPDRKPLEKPAKGRQWVESGPCK